MLLSLQLFGDMFVQGFLVSFIISLFFIALVSEPVSIKNLTELFKDGNWLSIALESVKLSVQ